MNAYSRALRYINIKDVKQKHQEKIVEQKIKEENERQEKEFIASVMETKKYDWRKELNEGMTSSGMFFTTLPATGDVNLAYPSWNSLGGYNYSISGGTVTITNSGVEGPESGIAASFDTSLYDTLVIDVGFSGDTILGVFASGANPVLLTTNSGTYNITVPQSKNQNLLFLSATLSNGTVTISNLRFQRRTPLNVFVSLDSPEATSFIRTDPIMANLSPKERLQKLQKMLDASDEYVEKILGKNFPGTGTRPAETIMPNSWETAQYSDATERSIDTMLLKSLQKGEFGRGPDIDKQIKNLQQNMRNNTPGGTGLPQAQADQDTQIAQQQRGATGTGVPDTTGTSPGSNPPPRSQMNYPREWLPKQAQSPTGQNTQVAHYEPQGELISEKKKLKSPEEILNKIPGYYDGKPAPLGFPIESPPEMKNGMHPDLVDGKKIADRFNRLDPQSAEAMPLTGNPEIDKKVRAAAKKPK